MIEKKDVLKALKKVIDPELNLNIVELGLVYNVSITSKEIEIEMTLTSPMCPVGPEIIQNTKNEVEKISENKKVTINLVWTPPWTPEKMSEEAKLKVGIL